MSMMRGIRWAAMPGAPSKAPGAARTCRSFIQADFCFSNRRFGVKHFQTLHDCSVDVAHGLALLFGIGAKALPSWDSRMRWNNLRRGLVARWATGSSGLANSPHPSSREGHHSTTGWTSRFLLSHLILQGCHTAATSLVQRNSLPPTQMRCMITAKRRASVGSVREHVLSFQSTVVFCEMESKITS
jgi:hypothetical protein